MPPIPSLSFGSSSSSKGEQSGSFKLSNSGDVNIGGAGVPKWFLMAAGGMTLLAGAVLLYRWIFK